MYNPQRKIKITSLAMSERGGYAPQYRRQFISKATPDTVEPPFVDLLNYSTVALDTLPIPNGWEAPRFAFVMQGECAPLTGGKLTFTVQGYTSHLGCDKDGGFDPDMDFIVNSMTLNRHHFEKTPTGDREFVMPVASSQVIVDPVWKGAYASDSRKMKVRPEDVFAAMKLNHIASFTADDVLDLRAMLDTSPICGSRRHLIPSQYLNDILTSYKRAQLDRSFGIQNEEDVLENARGYVQSEIARNHPFYRAMATLRDGFMTNFFSWKELMQLDPDVSDMTTISMGAPKRPEYASWTGQDLTTVSAWTVTQMVRGIMDTLGIQQVKFSATNLRTKEELLKDPEKQTALEVSDISSQDYDDLMPLLIASFKSRVEQCVLSDISMDGQLSYRLHVDSNIFGDTVVEIALDGNEMVRYCVPAFADALYTPLIMTEGQNLLVGDLENVICHMEANLNQGLMVVTGNPNIWGAI